MDFKEAVALARAGEERGFGYLYANTQESKYYLALQYMKNEEMAKDVLQDAYIKAFANLDKLEKPEAFSSWLGTIVANTAKNMLVKKKPDLFTDLTDEESNESYEAQIEDEKIENQPELAYTQKETQELVHLLIDSLSEEQRLCILMFHIEGASISEIAATMECSENTVKSRLNYGRKNLKAKAEELQKKGYKLYNVAPMPLLLMLLRSEERAMEASGALAAAGSQIEKVVFDQWLHLIQSPARGIKPVKNPAGGISTATKTGVLQTTAAKIATVAVVGICILGGAAYYKSTQPKPTNVQPTKTIEVRKNNTNAPVSTKETSTEKEVTEDEYSTLIKGDLTKEELEYVLAYGPEEIPAQGFEHQDYNNFTNQLCTSGNYVRDYGKDVNYQSQYSLDDLNRLFYAFTDYQFTKDNVSEYGFELEGDKLKFSPATLSYEVTAKITSATYTKDKMDVYFNYEKTSYENGTTASKKHAILRPVEDGKYRISKIEEVSDTSFKPSASPKADTASMKDIYAEVLKSVQNKKPGYEFSSNYAYTGEYEYFVADLDKDGIKELIVSARFSEDVFEYCNVQVYTCKETDAGYQLKRIKGETAALGLCIPKDGNGLYQESFSRGRGEYSIYRLNIENGKLVENNSKAIEFQMGTAEEKKFFNENPRAEMRDISDLTGLNDLERK